MTFKIGDEVIMTADSEKGRIFSGYKDGEYRGKVVSSLGSYPVMIELENGRKGSFYKDGSVPTYPGMSIRPAEEKVKLTPSQWIEGRVPEEDTGLFILLDTRNMVTWANTFCEGDDKELGYTHYIKYIYPPFPVPELPPPPPAKEVEAYGILERIKQIRETPILCSDTLGGKITAYQVIKEIDKARAFYSQPATAENKKKCFNEYTFTFENEPQKTLDNYINGYKGKLTFTPAALDELEIR